MDPDPSKLPESGSAPPCSSDELICTSESVTTDFREIESESVRVLVWYKREIEIEIDGEKVKELKILRY